MGIVLDSKACYGCRTCELVCSFHHTRAFSPEAASIKIVRHNETGEVSWSIDATCDLCHGESQPYCVQYCLYGALREVVQK